MRSDGTIETRGAATLEPGRTLRTALKGSCRQAAAFGFYRTGLLGVMRNLARTRELSFDRSRNSRRLSRSTHAKFGILCYHRVGTEGVPLYSRLAPAVFEAQMRYVKKHYRLVPLDQLSDELRRDADVAPTLAITFDDGYRDLYQYAFPVLQKYQIPATIYLIGQCMATGSATWYDKIFVALSAATEQILEVELAEPRRYALSNQTHRMNVAWEIICHLRSVPNRQREQWCADFLRRMNPPQDRLTGCMLDWKQVREMHANGISFGAHTMSHPAVSRLNAAELERELVASKSLLETGLNASVNDFCYPFGKPADCGKALEGFLARAHYRSAVTTTPGFNTRGTNPYQLRRLQVGDERSMASFAFNLARMFLETSEEPLPAVAAGAISNGPGLMKQRSTSSEV